MALTVVPDDNYPTVMNISGVDMIFEVNNSTGVAGAINIKEQTREVKVWMGSGTWTDVCYVQWQATGTTPSTGTFNPFDGILNEVAVWWRTGVGLIYAKAMSWNNATMTPSIPASPLTTTLLPTGTSGEAFSNNFVPIFGSNAFLFGANGLTSVISRYDINAGTVIHSQSAIDEAVDFSLARGVCVLDNIMYAVAINTVSGDLEIHTVDFSTTGTVALLETIACGDNDFRYARIAIVDTGSSHKIAVYGTGYNGDGDEIFFHCFYDVDADTSSSIATNTFDPTIFLGEEHLSGFLLSDRLIVILPQNSPYPTDSCVVIDVTIATDATSVTEIPIAISTIYPERFLTICNDAIYLLGQKYHPPAEGGYKYHVYKYTLASKTATEVFTSIEDYPTRYVIALVGSTITPYYLIDPDDTGTDLQVWSLSGLLTTITLSSNAHVNLDISNLVINNRIWICYQKGDSIVGYSITNSSDTITLTSSISTGNSFYWIGNGYVIRTDYTDLISHIEK